MSITAAVIGAAIGIPVGTALGILLARWAWERWLG